MPFYESYTKLENDDRQFDIDYWQAQGPKAIFEATYGMIKDYFLLRDGYANEPRLQRTVEHFQKI